MIVLGISRKAWVELNSKYGFIDKTGKEVVSCKYDSAWNFQEGLAWVELNSKYGFIDKTGKCVIPCKYDNVVDFYEGLAWVELNNVYFYIDTKGNLKFKETYKEVIANIQKGKNYKHRTIHNLRFYMIHNQGF